MTDDRQPTTDRALVFPVGLEQAEDGAMLVHSLSVPGCVAGGEDQERALAAFPAALSDWLTVLGELGEPLPEPDAELEIAVDEWILTDADVAAGESTACFDADRVPLEEAEVYASLRRLGDLRGRLLARVRRLRDAELDRETGHGWTLRRALDELARAQWWTLSRLGASQLGDVPDRTLGRLDTAMAMVVQRFTELPADARGTTVELDGEEWTPRKVLRRLLWLEWTLGNAVLSALDTDGR